MGPTYAIATHADIDTLVQFMREFYAFDHIPFEEAGARSAVTMLINDASLGRGWLICSDEEAIGYVVLVFGFSLEYRGRDAFVDELYLRENHRRHGIGTHTLQFLEEVCRSIGIRALHLEVSRENTKAQSVYRRAGFTDHDRYLMTRWIADPGTR